MGFWGRLVDLLTELHSPRHDCTGGPFTVFKLHPIAFMNAGKIGFGANDIHFEDGIVTPSILVNSILGVFEVFEDKQVIPEGMEGRSGEGPLVPPVSDLGLHIGYTDPEEWEDPAKEGFTSAVLADGEEDVGVASKPNDFEVGHEGSP